MTTSDKAHFLCFPICGARKSLPEPIGKDNEVPQEYTVAHYFAEAPEDIQIMILRKLAKDRSSFLAFSFANKHNLSMVLQTSFWRELLVSEGRGPSDKNLDLQKLFNLYYRRLYRCEGVEVNNNLSFRFLNVAPGIYLQKIKFERKRMSGAKRWQRSAAVVTKVELGQEGVSKSYNTDSSVVDTYNGILPFYVKAISPFPYMKYCELEGPIESGGVLTVSPFWHRVESKVSDTADTRCTTQNSAGRLGSEGRVLNIATAFVQGHQYISYSGFGIDMFYSTSKGPKCRVGPHLILNNVDQYVWRTATIATVQELARERGAELQLYYKQRIYACRIKFIGWTASSSNLKANCALKTNREHRNEPEDANNAATDDNNAATEDSSSNTNVIPWLLLPGQYREGDFAPQFCFAGKSSSASSSSLETDAEFEMLCYKDFEG